MGELLASITAIASLLITGAMIMSIVGFTNESGKLVIGLIELAGCLICLLCSIYCVNKAYGKKKFWPVLIAFFVLNIFNFLAATVPIRLLSMYFGS